MEEQTASPPGGLAGRRQTRARLRTASHFSSIIALALRVPFTILSVTAIAFVGALSGTIWRAQHEAIMRKVGVEMGTLVHLRLQQLALSTFYQSKPGIDWRMVVAIALIVGGLEYIVGSMRAALTFVISDIVTSIVAVLALASMGAAGWHYAHAAARTPDSGSSVAMLACAGALAMVLPGWKRTAGLLVLAVYVLPALLWWSFATWLAHLIGTCIGIVFGAAFRGEAATRMRLQHASPDQH